MVYLIAISLPSNKLKKERSMKHSVEQLSLPTGSNGLFVDVPGSNVFYCQLRFRSGDLFCPEDKPEIAHFMEHMSFMKNKEYANSADLMEDFEKNGAVMNASTGAQDVCYWFKSADFEWERLLQLLIMVLTTCQFESDSFETEREVIRDELTRRLTLYKQTLHFQMRRNLSGRDLSFQSRLKLLDNVQLSDLQGFYEQIFYINNLQFVFYGDLETKKDKIGQMLTSMNLPNENKQPIARYNFKFTQPGEPVVVVEDFLKKIHFSLCFYKNSRLSPIEHASLKVVAEVLTGSLSAILTRPVREKGLSYGIGSYADNCKDHSSFTITTEMAEDKALDLFKVIAETIKLGLSGKISKEQIEVAKARLTGWFYNVESRSADLSKTYMNEYFEFDNVRKYPDFIVEQIKKVDKKQFDEAFKYVFSKDGYCLGLIGANVENYKKDLYQIIADVVE